MRTSAGALALITRVNSFGQTEFLTQWNEKWQAYSLIGGHVEDGETFHQACVREITEELNCTAHEITAAPYPYATLRFHEFSRSARQVTDYHWQVFVVRLQAGVLQEPLQNDCAWVAADRIRARFTTDGKSIAEQVYRVLQAVENAEFDLFVSYGHADNDQAAVTNLIEHIRQEHEQFSPNDPLKIFFDLWKIRDGEDWERRIYRGLIKSKTMLAVLSPAYFASEWCRREYETFAQQQLKHTYPGEPVHAIYIHPHPDFDSGADHPQRGWFDALKKKQFLDAKPWWPDGRQALEREVVAGRLRELREKIWERVCDARTAQHSPTNLRDPG